MDKQEKAALLAEHVMGWHLDGAYWANKSGHWQYAVGNSWSPFDEIGQAQEVLNALINKGYRVIIHCGQRRYNYVVDVEPNAITGVAGDTMESAICEAAGKALGLWE